MGLFLCFLDFNWVCKNFGTVSLYYPNQLVINKRVFKLGNTCMLSLLLGLVGWGSLSLPLVGGGVPTLSAVTHSPLTPSPAVAEGIPSSRYHLRSLSPGACVQETTPSLPGVHNSYLWPHLSRMLAPLRELTVARKSPPWVDFTFRTYKQLRGWSHFSKGGDLTKPILYKKWLRKTLCPGGQYKNWPLGSPHPPEPNRGVSGSICLGKFSPAIPAPIPVEATHPLPVTHNSCLLFHLLHLDFFI